MEKKQRPQDKWNEKNGLVSRTYKLNKEIADKFDEACKTAGKSKKSQLERMMQEFIYDVELDVKKAKLLGLDCKHEDIKEEAAIKMARLLSVDEVGDKVL